MSEIEVPTEQLQETIEEHVHAARHGESGHGHGASGATGESLPIRVALSSAFLALLAAVAALVAGAHENEAMLEQLQASDQWSFYQAKSIKATVIAGLDELAATSGKERREESQKKVEHYQEEMKEIMNVAQEKEAAAKKHLARHETLARAVTLFQVGIALGALAVLTRKRNLWLLSVALGIGGLAFFAQGLL